MVNMSEALYPPPELFPRAETLYMTLAKDSGLAVSRRPRGENSSYRLFRRFQVLEALAPEDQETVITVIDAMTAKPRSASAQAPLDAQP